VTVHHDPLNRRAVTARPCGAVTLSGEWADLLMRLADLLGVLDYAEVASLADVLGRHHGLLAWTRKPAQ
jgi:hypothetical protein